MFLTHQKNLSFWLENLVNKLWSPTENIITLPTFANLLLLLSRDTLRYLSSLWKTPNICPESSFFYIKFYGKLKILRGFYQSFLRSLTVAGEWTTTQSFFKGKKKIIVKCQPFSLEKLKGWQYKSLSQG